MYRHCFICPTYGHYDYARASLQSFFEHTAHGVAVVVDDGNPEFFKFWDKDWNVVAHQFPTRRGLTRSWNFGLTKARELSAKYTICGNDDVLFTPNWHLGPVALLESEVFSLVGPLSNAPGVTNNKQKISDYTSNYKLSDNQSDLRDVSEQLAGRFGVDAYFEVHAVNGFFMISQTAKWWAGRYDNNNVFNPARKFSLVGNEDELQRRFRAKRWRIAVSLRSFIFHYRSVTRGKAAALGMWHRRAG